VLRRLSIAAGTLLCAAVLAPATAPAASTAPLEKAHQNPLRGNGMWIWYVSQSAGGGYSRIAREANAHRIGTIYVKSSDGSSAWSQFTHRLVSFMHQHGLRVCAWQYVYGTYPGREARRGAEAVRKGADCLIIDAESEYEGRYAAASRYIHALRDRIGRHFPVSLAGFPYVDYHPSFPYSVFLGPGGAQFNQPQLYWYAIGTTVSAGYRHTFTYNRVYRRRIMPIGQTWENPPVRQIERFRRYAHSYGFPGVSWWDWQETSARSWRALRRKVGDISGFQKPTDAYPVLRRGSSGDLVVWAQELLRGAGKHVPVTGYFKRLTDRAVRHFQADHKLGVDGVIGPQTWRALLKQHPDAVNWAKRAKAKGAAGAPPSASLPAVRDEIPPAAERTTAGP
jgi:hypothetical protein